MSTTATQDSLPLTEATFYILLSLAPGPKHGYAIMKDVAALSGGRTTLSTGTLYGALARLLERGWVVRLDDDGDEESGRGRKAYELTALGRRLLTAEAARMEALVTTANLRLAEEPK